MWPFKAKPAVETKSFILMTGSEIMPDVALVGGALEQLIVASSAVFACVTANADGVAGMPGVVQRRNSEAGGRWIEDRSTQLDEWLEAPGKGCAASWDWGLLIAHATLCLELTGRWVALIITSTDGRLLGLQPLVGSSLSVVRAADGSITEWIVDAKRVDASRIMHLQKPSPTVDSLGMSPWEAAKAAAEIDQAARSRQVYSLRNIAAPGIIVTMEGGLSDTQRKAVLADFQDQYVGASKEGKPMLLGGNAKVTQPPTFSARSYLDLRSMSIEDIGRIYRTPDVVMGRGKDASRFVDSLRTWLNAALYPLLRLIYGGLNRQVIRPIYGREMRVWFDIRDSQFALAVRGEQAELALSLLNLGYTANTAAAYAGLDLPYDEALDVPNVRFAIAGRADSESINGSESASAKAQPDTRKKLR